MNAVTQESLQLRPRVLFVDDSRLMRMCAQKILGPRFDLIVADSAEVAWETLQADPSIQVLFTDLQMPGKSGYELLRMVRASDSPRLAEMPVVLITGAEDHEEARNSALKLGASDFITKPFQASELMARAASYADSGRSRQRLRLLERNHHLDHATGLGNRRYCEQRLAQAISFAVRHNQPLTLMHLRLEGLGRLLDDLGEDHARRALGRIGQTLARSVRQEDTVFRTGQESFTFLLPATHPGGAETLQGRFLPDLDTMGLEAGGQGLDVSPRFVVQPISPDTQTDARQLLQTGLAGATDKASGAGGVERQARANPSPAPDLEQALAMIERGQTEALHRHLPHLRRRLQPLLELVGRG